MRIFFITSRFPFPLEKGDKLRAYELIRHLSAYHEIYLFALNEESVENSWEKKLFPYCKEVHYIPLSKVQRLFGLARALFNGRPFSTEYFYSKSVQTKVDQLLNRIQPDLIFSHLIRTAQYVRHRPEQKILDYMDVFSKGMDRRRNVESGLMKFASEKEYRRLLKFEREVFDDFDGHTIISEQDRDLIPHTKNQNIYVLPNGVELDYYHPKELEKNYDLIFVGNMAYPPNIQAVKFLVEEVMPLVWEERPETNVCIAGAEPGPIVRKLESEKVHVTGWVDDVREYSWQSRLMMAPMRISIGLQNKILQGMSLELPCVVSDMANNAVGAEPGLHLMEAHSEQDYCDAILELLSSPEKAKEIGRQGRLFVQENYDWVPLIKSFNDRIIEHLHA